MAGPGLPPSWPSPSSSSTPRSSTGGRGWSYFLRPGTSTFQLPGINKKVKFRLYPNILLIRIQRFSYTRFRTNDKHNCGSESDCFLGRIQVYFFEMLRVWIRILPDANPFRKLLFLFFNKPVPFLNKNVKKKWWAYCGSGSAHFFERIRVRLF